MNISNICKTIKNFFRHARVPVPSISNVLVVCSSINKPGMSVIESTSRIVKDLEKVGIPTGPMPDGSVNLNVAMTFAIVKEVQRMIKEDMQCEGGQQPGSVNVQVGPSGTGTNLNTGRTFIQCK